MFSSDRDVRESCKKFFNRLRVKINTWTLPSRGASWILQPVHIGRHHYFSSLSRAEKILFPQSFRLKFKCIQIEVFGMVITIVDDVEDKTRTFWPEPELWEHVSSLCGLLQSTWHSGCHVLLLSGSRFIGCSWCAFRWIPLFYLGTQLTSFKWNLLTPIHNKQGNLLRALMQSCKRCWFQG